MSLGSVSVAKITCAACAKHQTKVNFILNRIVPVTLCDWMNNLQAIWKEIYFGGHLGTQCVEWTDLYELHVKLWEFLSERKSFCELLRLEQRFWSYFEQVLFSSQLENGALQNSAIQLPPHTFLVMNFYASEDIWHTSSSFKLPQDPVCSWAKPKTRILATILSAILSRFTSFHRTNANEVSNEMIFNAIRKCSNIVIWKIVI